MSVLVHNFSDINPIGGAVYFRDNGRILVVGKTTRLANIPQDFGSEITDSLRLRSHLQTFVNNPSERDRLYLLCQDINLLATNGLFLNTPACIDMVVSHLGLGVRAFLFDDEHDLVPGAGAGGAVTSDVGVVEMQRPATGTPVSSMPIEDRLMEALQRAPSYMDEAAAAEFRQLLAPASIAMIVASLIALAAVAATGVGGVIVLAVGWACVGWAIFEAAGHFIDFFSLVNNAKSEDDINRAAEMLARAVIALGIGALMAFLTKGASRAATKGGRAVREAVEEASERARKKADDLRQTGGASGRHIDPADEAYEAIRASRTDVTEIANNTGLKESNIQKVKDHLFYNEHRLDRYEELGIPAEYRRFDSNMDIANIWKRLENGTFTPDDINLLKHEIAEAWYMKNVSPGYNAAHNAAQSRFPSPLE